jgi:superfamily II DNA or RNA helicase
MQSLRNFFSNYAPNLLGEELVEPNPLQINALKALEFYRSKGWKKGVVILPTGTGKTILSALDARIFRGKVLFIVHRLDILKQSISAYKKVWNQATIGILTGESRENELNCDILFASKDTLRQTTELTKYRHDEFDYIVIDEVYHGQTPSYREIFSYFKPRFMLGMTATPDRSSKSYLTPSQLEEIEQWLIPLERRNISELERHLIEEYDVVFKSPESYYKILRDSQLSWQKGNLENPKKKPEVIAKRNQEIAEMLRGLTGEIESGQLLVYALDECHLQGDDICSYLWGDRENREVIQVENQRNRQTGLTQARYI